MDSILGQTLTNIEIILINDGSKDGSLEIIKEYAKKDDRIRVIDKPNEGYGKTMNRGMEAARGKYIGIVESDDWIEPDMYETLYALAEKHDLDVAKSRYIPFDDKTGKDEKIPDLPEYDLELVINPRRNPAVFYFAPSIWSAIYKREFLRNNEIVFLETPGASFQDVAFNFKLWAMAKKIYLTAKPLVHYRIGHSSQSVQSKEKVFCVCDEFREIERYMASHPELFKKLERIFNLFKFNTYTWNLSRLDGKNKEEFRKTMHEELAQAVKNDAIDWDVLTIKGRLKILKTVYPRSVYLKIRYTMQKLIHLLIKERVRNGFVETRIVFGMILLRKRRIRYKGIE